jgi:hypothetical protein
MIYATLLIILGATSAQKLPPAAVYACDPALTALFTPRQPLMGRYEVCTTREPLGDDEGEAIEALDAFGTAGAYKRSALARLYGGRRVRVVRRWTDSGGRFESVTRLSPYPDASLTRLWPGTMEIRWTVQR